MINLVEIQSEEVVKSVPKSFDSIDKFEVSAFPLVNELFSKVKKNKNKEDIYDSKINEFEKDMYYDKKYSIFFSLTGGNGYGRYDQPNEFFQLQYLIIGDIFRAFPYTATTNFKGNYGDGLRIGLDYRKNKNIAFSLSYSNDSVYFRSVGVDFTKFLYGSFAALNGFSVGYLYPYVPSKYILGVSTYNLGTDYYFYSNTNQLEFYVGGEIGWGSFDVVSNSVEEYITHDSKSAVKLSLRTGMQYNFKDRHHIKIEPFYSYSWGDRFHLNYIGVSLAYMYTFGVSD